MNKLFLPNFEMAGSGVGRIIVVPTAKHYLTSPALSLYPGLREEKQAFFSAEVIFGRKKARNNKVKYDKTNSNKLFPTFFHSKD